MTKVMKRVMVLVLSLAMVVGMFPATSSVRASKKTSAIKSENGDVFDFSKGDNAKCGGIYAKIQYRLDKHIHL